MGLQNRFVEASIFRLLYSFSGNWRVVSLIQIIVEFETPKHCKASPVDQNFVRRRCESPRGTSPTPRGKGPRSACNCNVHMTYQLSG